jgi:epoxyqueuosine reductase
MEIHIDEVAKLASEFGLSLFASIPIVPGEGQLDSFPEFARSETKHLKIWQDKGYAAEMSYMERSSDMFLNPAHFLPGARSILSFSISYHYPNDVTVRPEGYGRVAKYAWGRDYHRVLKKRLSAFATKLGDMPSSNNAFKWRVFTDAVPLLERALARYANLGFTGRNTMLIRPGFGSYFFIAELICNADIYVPQEKQMPSSKGSCGSCNACLPSCPTAALVSSKVLDAGRCISYLTIEKKTELSPEEQRWLGEWVFGCDICQDVCPFNHENIALSSVAEFDPSSGCGPFLDLRKILKFKDRQEYLGVFAGTPLMRTGRVGLMRNATCVVANTNYFPAINELIELYREESSEILRSHAFWALQRMRENSDGLDRSRISAALDAGLG